MIKSLSLLAMTPTTSSLTNFSASANKSSFLFENKIEIETDDVEYFENFDSTVFRFTVVDTDGTVLYDTQVNASEMENHAEREEILEPFGKFTLWFGFAFDKEEIKQYAAD